MSAVAPTPFVPRPGHPSRVRALVVDENVASRVAIRDLLGSLGIDQVVQASEPMRAIRLMEGEPFGLVLCDLKFRAKVDGLQVLEYVRTRRLLPPASAFVLVSGDADRSVVAAARDWQPDGFVLKPLTAASLGPRIEQALRRRAALAPVHDAAERGDAHALLARARRLAAQSAVGGAAVPSLELMRFEMQALVDLGRYAEAAEVCERAMQVREDLPWVQIGLAHRERASGRADAACARLRETIRVYPWYGGAYDLLIEILQSLGRTDRALEVARGALEQIATSRRARALGELAYAHGELELAEKCYADLIRRTSGSPTRNALDVGMLGQVFVGQGDSDKALQLVAEAHVDTAGDEASQALAASVQAQAHAARGDEGAAEAAARRALGLVSDARPTESVALLVARGAFSAGLRDEAQALVQRAIADRARPFPPGALARRVLSDAGIEPEAFVAQALGAPEATSLPAGAGEGVPVLTDVEPADADAPAEAAGGTAAPADAAAVGAGAADGADAAGSSMRPPATDVELALASLQQARFDEAVLHVDRARQRLPSNPMVLMATVQVYLLRMRALGFDEAAAAEVRRCLAEIDRQIPGGRRVFDAAAAGG